MTEVPLGDLIRPAGRKAGSEIDLPVYSVTKHAGFVPSLEYFKKQVFSRDTEGYKLVEPGNFAYATIHLDEGSIGIAPEQALISPMYTVFSVDESRIDSGYLLGFLKSPRALAHYPRLGRGAIHRRKTISLSALGSLTIALPTLTEQRRIVAILNQADGVRAKRCQELALLAELSHSLFARSTEAAQERTIQELLDAQVLAVHKDGNHGSLYPRAEEFALDGVPFLTAKAIRDDGSLDAYRVDHLREEKASKLRVGWIQAGDVLLSHNASVGKVATYRGEFGPALIGTSLTCFRVDPARMDSSFLAASLRADSFQRQLVHNMAQTTRNQVPITAQRKLTLPWVDLERQRKLAAMLRPVGARVDAVRRAIHLADRLRVSLQARAFRGGL